MREDGKPMFLEDKPCICLKIIADEGRLESASVLSSMADTTYSHAVKITNKFEREGYIERVDEGRSKTIKISEKGREVADAVDNLLDVLKYKIPEQDMEQRTSNKHDDRSDWYSVING